MQEDSDELKAIGYLKELLTLIPIRYNKHHLPDAIFWMTPFMKNNLILYGDILCLDGQKIQHSHLG